MQRQLTLWRWLGSRLAWEPTARCLEDEEHLPRDWHESLAAALSQGDPVLAERTMRHHVRRGMKVIAKSVGSVPATAAAAKRLDGRAQLGPRRVRACVLMCHNRVGSSHASPLRQQARE